MVRFWHKRLEKSSFKRPLYPLKVNLKFNVQPVEKREEYVKLLDEMVKRLENS